MRLDFVYQEWPYAKVFRISREVRVASSLFVAYLRDGDHIGRGECGVLTQYGRTQMDIAAGFRQVQDITDDLSRDTLRERIPLSEVRNAIDCALWDLECKKAGDTIWRRAGVEKTDAIEVDITIGIDTEEVMMQDAERAVGLGYKLLKIKSDAENILSRVRAIRLAAPGVKFVVDANEAWTIDMLREIDQELHDLGVAVIEQPLPYGADEALEGYKGPIPICADESCRDLDDLPVLEQRYDAINIKLDKVGGLTDGLKLARAAREKNMGLMIGCHGPTSLGIAPAYVLGTMADYNDLDAPSLFLEDRAHAMTYENGMLRCFTPDLWG